MTASDLDASGDRPGIVSIDASDAGRGDDAARDAATDLNRSADTSIDEGADDASEACSVRRCGVDVACGIADFGCASPLVCPPCGQTLKIVAIDDAKHLALDRASGQLFVSAGSAGGAHANQVVSIDPVLAKVTGTLSIPDGPDLLTISDDGSRLWITVASGAALRWVDLTGASPVVSPPVALPAAADGSPSVVGGIGAVPGAPHSVAVSLIYAAQTASATTATFVFDDGTVRAAHSPVVGPLGLPSQFIGGPPGVLFQMSLGTSPAPPMVTVHVTSTAVTEVPHDDSFTTGNAVYSDGILYGNYNVAFDVHDPDHPILLGPLMGDAPFNHLYGTLLVPSPGRVFLVGSGALNLELSFFDVAAQRAVTSSALSGTGQGALRDLVAVPPARMAMIYEAAAADSPTRIFVITHDLLGTP
jgi:hypothetical protein